MANETLITDLVAQQALDQLEQLDRKMEGTMAQFKDCAMELAKGLKIPVEVQGDLSALRQLSNDVMQRATQATQQYTQQLQQQQQVIANTTAAIAEQLQKQAQSNEATRQANGVNREAMAVTDKVLGSLQQNIHLQAQYKIQLEQVSAEQSRLKKQFEQGRLTSQQYADRLAAVTTRKTELTVASQKLQRVINADQKIMNSAEGSYEHMSQSLARLKQALRSDDAQSLTKDEVQLLIQAEQQLSNELKHQDELLGEHHRNVGDYAIALENGVVQVDSLNAVLTQNAATIEGCIEQNKALEDAKTKLDTQDANYSQTLDAINQKIAENKQRISDVSDILGVQAHSVEEAEQQNKRLAEALRLVDDRQSGASEKIQAYNEQIKVNKKYIEDHTKGLQDNAKASDALLGQIRGLIGGTNTFGSSLKSLSVNAASGGTLLTGMGNSLKAFGKTLLGLLKNPYVLAIAGVVAGFKWFYDYNKGLIEASRLTKYFTGLTGDAMRSVRDNVQAVSDTFGKNFNETLKTANAMSKNLGVSVNEATDIIAKGLAAGGMNSEQYLSNLQRFAPTFQKMGMTAEQAAVAMSQIDKSGVNSQRALMAMSRASLQLRTMSEGTAKSLNAIGVDAQQMSQDVQSGARSVQDAMAEVARKLQETGSNSKEAAAVMKELFGARGESAIGDGFLTFLAESNKGMEELLGKQDSLQRLKLKEVEVNKELNDVLASLFDMTGGGFESITLKCKIWIKEGLVSAIKWVVDLINYFIDWYNESLVLRAAVNGFIMAWKNGYATLKVIFNVVIDAIKALGRNLKALGDIVEGVFTLSPEKVSKGFGQLMENFKVTWKEVANDAKSFGKEVADNFTDALDKTMRPKLVARLDYNAVGNADIGDGGTGRVTGGAGSSTGGGGSDKKAKELDKTAKEELKIVEQLEEAKVKAMEDGIEKTLALIRLQYKKEIDAIKGNSEAAQKLRLLKAKELAVKLAQAQAAYDTQRADIDLKNRLATVKEGSEEEYTLKLNQLEKQREAEIAEAKKTGADVALINAKYRKQEEDLLEEHIQKQMEILNKKSANAQLRADADYEAKVEQLEKEYSAEIRNAKHTGKTVEQIKADYNRRRTEIDNQYADDTLQRQIDLISSQLQFEDMGQEEREKLQLELTKLTKQLARQRADAEKQATEEAVQADEAAAAKRKQNLQDWAQRAGEAIGRISDFMSALYDNQIQKIEELLEAEQERYDQEVNHIDYLAEHGAITEEEAEIRKRDAAAATAAKQEQLEKKKAQIEYRKALMEKANTIAQIGMATALGIMQALAMFPPNIPLSSFIGAMGAIQLATALAQPIKAYAEGTKGKPHPGGLALVGDGGSQELVMYDGKAYVTPDSPTLVDLPRGAEVIPDITTKTLQDLGASLNMSIPRDRSTGQPIVINDYSALESRVASNTKAVTKALREHQIALTRQLKRQKFNAYIARRT